MITAIASLIVLRAVGLGAQDWHLVLAQQLE